MNVEDNRSADRLRSNDIWDTPPSPTSSGYSSASSLYFKSDGSKENTLINFKETRSILSPELQRPESAGRRMTRRRNRSADRLRSNDSIRLHKDRLKTSSMIIIHDFKESSSPSPEQQRPESAGRRMAGRRNRSADRLRSNDKCDISESPTSSGYSSTSKLYFKSDGSNENTIIDFKETWSHLSPEQQRPESAGRRMAAEDNWSTLWHRFRERIRLHKSRTRQMSREKSKEYTLDF